MADRRLRLWLLALDRFEYELRPAIARGRTAFLKAAASDYETTGHVAAHRLTTHRKQVASALDTHYRRVVPHFAAHTLRQVKSRRIETKAAQSLYDALVAEWIGREALRKATLIAGTDRDDVLRAIEQGLTEGQGTAEIATNIRKVSQLTPFRAATVARTETHAAATFASAEAAREAERTLDVRLLKEWGPTRDDRTRPEHLAMSGYGPIPTGEKFSVGGDQMDRPGDPSASPANLVNCRCTLFLTEASA